MERIKIKLPGYLRGRNAAILWRLCAAVIILFVGIGIGFLFDSATPSSVENVREDSAEYHFINPLLYVKISEDQAFPEYLPLKKTLSSFIEQMTDEHKVTDVSVHFRDLDSSQWISLYPEKQFSPASMLKVVTLISILRVAESDPHLLSKRVIVKGDDSSEATSQTRYQPAHPIRSGNTYSVDELIEHLVVESDNVANTVLTNLIGEEKIEKTYNDLQLPEPESADGTFYTAQEYSRLFRALYNGTYLSRQLSEKVLQLLSTTTFTQGIVAGVPKDTTVSHKFGVRTIVTKDEKGNEVTLRELHDCGIVYYSTNPYFVCVMTRGNDLETLESIIRDASKIVWDFVNSSKK